MTRAAALALAATTAALLGLACSDPSDSDRDASAATPRRGRPARQLPTAEGSGRHTTTDDAAAAPAASGADAATPQARGPLELTFQAIELQGDADAITDFAFIPGSEEFLLLHKGGQVSHYLLQGDSAQQLGGFRLTDVDDIADCGLISLAFDPDFESNRFVYFAYCEDRDYSRVTRHVFDPGDYAATVQSASLVIRAGEDSAPEPWHNIGAIGFDEGGSLWILLGEKADKPRAQQLDGLLGKVLRIDPERAVDDDGYSIAASNPFVGVSQRQEEIVAYGLRSPWRGHLDSRGRLWIGDTGSSEREELNLLEDFDGRNFAWPLHEGECTGQCSGLTDPVVNWTREDNDPFVLDDFDAAPTTRRVIWVGIEYRSDEQDRYRGLFDGRLVYGDFCVGFVRAIELDELGGVAYDRHAGHLQGITSWRQGPDGYAYAVTYGNRACQTFPYGEGGLYRARLAE